MKAQEEFTHYYLKIDGSDADDFEVELGVVSYDEAYNPRQIEIDSLATLDLLTEAIARSLAEERTSDQLNVVIHGIWGDYSFAWKEMVRNLSRDVYTTDDGKKQVLLSIIWDSSLNYFSGVKIARRKGDHLGPFLAKLIDAQSAETKISFLCHSMGNRIFQHMILSSGLLEKKEQVIDHYIAAGADLESAVFDQGETLAGIDKIVKDVTIYVHNNDRSLKMSKLVNKNKRLGLDGVDLSKMPDNFSIIDVSVITDHVNFSSSMSNHRYFYMSPTVVKDIRRLVWEKDYVSEKKVLDHPRRYKLLPEE